MKEQLARNLRTIYEHYKTEYDILHPAILEAAEELERKEIIIPYTSILKYVGEKVRFLESQVKSAAVLQLTDHPMGMAMILRIYVAKYDKEYSFPDIILMVEMDSFDSAEKEKARIDVLFDEIHRALNSLQIISGETAKSAGIIH